MRILMIGDVYGRSGREALARHLPELRTRYTPDAIIVNVDNAAHGKGVIPSVVQEIYDLGVDMLTGGDHVWGHREMITHLDRAPYVLRPLNHPAGTVGKGWHILTIGQKKLLVVHLQGRTFLERATDNPFAAIDTLLKKYNLGSDVHGIVVDFHAEATSEKNAMGLFLDGRVSAVVGTHTHIPTADARILPRGTGYITDMGMTGDYNSVIGADPVVPLQKFISGIVHDRMKPTEGEATVCGVLVTLDSQTGLTQKIEQILVGGVLQRGA